MIQENEQTDTEIENNLILIYDLVDDIAEIKAKLNIAKKSDGQDGCRIKNFEKDRNGNCYFFETNKKMNWTEVSKHQIQPGKKVDYSNTQNWQFQSLQVKGLQSCKL